MHIYSTYIHAQFAALCLFDNFMTDERTILYAQFLVCFIYDEAISYSRTVEAVSTVKQLTGKFVLLTYSLKTSHQTTVHCCFTEVKSKKGTKTSFEWGGQA